MPRNLLVSVLTCSLVTGCITKGDSGIELVGHNGPRNVTLPFRVALAKGEIHLKLEAVPERPQAVKATVQYGLEDLPDKTWTQEGKGVVEVNTKSSRLVIT